MALNIEIALRVWISDEGYRKINSYLSENPEYRYHKEHDKIIFFEDKTYNTEEVVQIIKEHMKISSRPKTYYRGGSTNSKKSFQKKTFISVSTDKEQAESFIDNDCCLYKIIVDSDVKRIKVGVENEVLLENDVYWEYTGKQGDEYLVKIHKHSPSESTRETDPMHSLTTALEINNSKLMQFYNELKEVNEDLELEEEITPSDLIKYISSVTNGRINISPTKAAYIIQTKNDASTAGGNKKNKKNKNSRRIKKKHTSYKKNKKTKKHKKKYH